MRSQSPELSVIVITHDRPRRLAALLSSLRCQTLATHRFEVVVVDDASGEDTAELLRTEQASARFELRVVRRRDPNRAAARNVGWQTARGRLVAYIDDDCVASPDWLQEGLKACDAHPGAVVQGRVDPIPAEAANQSPATRTQRVHQAGPYYQTCNIFYPRQTIAELGGFDAAAFTRHGGEDTDLAWRAISMGVPTAFADQAQAYHAVNRIGLWGRLQFASHWSESMLVYKRYPALRAAVFTKTIFWKPWHYALFRVLVAQALPRRLWFLRPYLVIPYLRSVEMRIRHERGGVLHAWFYPLEDAVEVTAMIRASIRHRMLVL